MFRNTMALLRWSCIARAMAIHRGRTVFRGYGQPAASSVDAGGFSGPFARVREELPMLRNTGRTGGPVGGLLTGSMKFDLP
jgi:hypothetical protein